MAEQQWNTSSLGGYLAQPYLTSRLRTLAQPEFKWRQFVDVQENIGKNRGDTWLYDMRGNVLVQGGTLVETATVPQTNFKIGQGTGTITEYGLSVPYSGKLELLGQIPIEPAVEQALRDDAVKVLESACGAQYVATEYTAVMSATNSVVFTTNGTAAVTATSDLTAFNVRKIVDYMKKKLIPKYDGANYVCIASVQALSGLFSDTGTGGWSDVSKYTAEYAQNIFNGEVGKYYMTRFVEETGYLSNTIGASSLYGAACFFGADSVYEAVALPEEIRVKVSVDFGRDQALAWIALLGFKKVWTYSADFPEQHIVYVTSA